MVVGPPAPPAALIINPGVDWTQMGPQTELAQLAARIDPVCGTNLATARDQLEILQRLMAVGGRGVGQGGLRDFWENHPGTMNGNGMTAAEQQLGMRVILHPVAGHGGPNFTTNLLVSAAILSAFTP